MSNTGLEQLDAMDSEQAQMVEKAKPFLQRWGLGNARPIAASALKCGRWEGARAGDIVEYLGLAEREEIDHIMSGKPKGARTLEYLRDNGIRRISNHMDEILCIQKGVCYLSERFDELEIHPQVLEQDSAFFKNHQDELNARGFLPMQCNGSLLLLFNNFDQTVQLRGLGRKECLDSSLLETLSRWVRKSPEYASDFKVAVTSSAVFQYFLETLRSGGASERVEEGMQVISGAEGAESPVMHKLVHIIEDAIRLGVNDVAISPDYKTGGALVEYRISQEMSNSGITLNPEEREQVINTLLSRSKANTSASRVRQPLDGNLGFTSRVGEAFIRLSFIPLEESRMAALSVSMRILPKSNNPIVLSKLGIVKSIEDELNYLLRLRDGLFVVAGPTGSGKSTTIGGMLCKHYEVYGDKRKRLSVEQPVERILPGVKHIDVEQHQYRSNGEAKQDVDKFSMALRALLRHDPDVIFVGEVRDRASCMVTIDAANTGHLVMTTTHANDTVLAYRRLASFLDKERQYDLVNVLSGILAQRLVQLVCQDCSTVQPIDDQDRDQLRRYSVNKGVSLDGKVFEQKRVASSKGCKNCRSGISGMTGIHGLLIMTPQIRSLLLSDDEADWMKAQQVGSRVTLFDSAYELFNQGKIELGSMLI